MGRREPQRVHLPGLWSATRSCGPFGCRSEGSIGHRIRSLPGCALGQVVYCCRSRVRRADSVHPRPSLSTSQWRLTAANKVELNLTRILADANVSDSCGEAASTCRLRGRVGANLPTVCGGHALGSLFLRRVARAGQFVFVSGRVNGRHGHRHQSTSGLSYSQRRRIP
jgi:hypothetical protein